VKISANIEMEHGSRVVDSKAIYCRTEEEQIHILRNIPYGYNFIVEQE
jgi:hypothetical protein